LEIGAKVVVALNMGDIAESRGLKIDVQRLSQALGAPVVNTVASRGAGLDALKRAIADTVAA